MYIQMVHEHEYVSMVLQYTCYNDKQKNTLVESLTGAGLMLMIKLIKLIKINQTPHFSYYSARDSVNTACTCTCWWSYMYM